MADPPLPRPAPASPAPPTDGSGCIVWHRRHLRTTDHPALSQAAREYDTLCPLFVFDPHFYGDASLACDARIRFLHECLADLREQYTDRGGELTRAHGDPIAVLENVVDADPAINYTQFQSQAGVVGTNMLRTYNPRKQVRDNDPEGAFVRRWVPELDPLPVEHLDQPEKTPLHVQDECGITIGEDHPYPVVEYEAARQARLDEVESLQDRAEAALSDPEVARRASLSLRGRTNNSAGGHDDDPGDDDGPQTSLFSF
ncbi:FAD-binding domain-containing protein [Halomicroarcula sp. GCM10025817]|uniref:FAD-binding domain-containing protein n=1 Tax=Haloarcula TaxID=2237 RepID=UPI0023E7DEC2|nr:FAD-binding domain-containing protein [Halomicroarcula sp. SYNS111]